MLNPVEGNAISRIREAEAWLAEPNNGELPLWSEVLAVHVLYKLSLAHWLPHMKDTPEENASKKLVNAFTSNDALVLDFIKRIKPAARNLGITWHSGPSQPLCARCGAFYKGPESTWRLKRSYFYSVQ